MNGLHHPELFSSACQLSALLGPLLLTDAKARLERKSNKPVTASDAAIEAHYKRLSALELITNIPEDQKKAVRWYKDCGDDDFLFEGNSLAHIAMLIKEIPHEFRVRNGGHTWTYWREALPIVLSLFWMHFTSTKNNRAQDKPWKGT